MMLQIKKLIVLFCHTLKVSLGHLLLFGHIYSLCLYVNCVFV